MEENKKIELEVKIRQCSKMMLDLNCLRQLNPNLTDKLLRGHNKISIGEVDFKSGKEISCAITREPCVLYHKPLLGVGKIDYTNLSRCPASKDFAKIYLLKGVNTDHGFCVSVVEGIL